MGRGKLSKIAGIAAFGAASVGVVWSPFSSAIYPYTISQPSTFIHIVLRDASNTPIDYFFPALGSSITYLSVWAGPGQPPRYKDRVAYLKAFGGRNVRISGSMRPDKYKVSILCADFKSIVGRYTIERLDFYARGLVWHVIASYDVRFRTKVRKTLLRMMHSFRLR